MQVVYVPAATSTVAYILRRRRPTSSSNSGQSLWIATSSSLHVLEHDRDGVTLDDVGRADEDAHDSKSNTDETPVRVLASTSHEPTVSMPLSAQDARPCR